MKASPTAQSFKGLAVATSLVCLWSIHLYFGLNFDFNNKPSGLSVITFVYLFLAQTFLYTGLFITAHDGMHGLIAPKYPKANRAVAQLCLTLYAFFDFSTLLKKHQLHHRYPGTDQDPDFLPSYLNSKTIGHLSSPFWIWYFNFFKNYFRLRQLVLLIAVSLVLEWLFFIPKTNVFLFWAFPAILSSFQLFYFGTFLPHRQAASISTKRTPFKDHHRARSLDYPVWLSFLSCYHFGYHWEHHAYPELAWWQLPQAKKSTIIK